MDITPEEFERFLTWLDPNRERAAAKYLVIQSRVIKYFICRGCGVDSEGLADETITRVVKKTTEIAATYVGEPLLYFLGVARNVFLEYLKRLLLTRASQPPPRPDSGDEKEMLDRCLDRCLKRLTNENRNMILGYYTGERQDKIVQRKKLADEAGIAPNALRIRAHRIRTDLRGCVEYCVAEDSGHQGSVTKVKISEEKYDETN